jgi:hypothetical protein
MGQRCHCGKALKPFRPSPRRKAPTKTRCEVTDVIGQMYCWQPAVVEGDDGNRYCRRHKVQAVGIPTVIPKLI